ncbi:MAG: hypothetical protein ACOYMA_21685 [Bacteroidia bacterium]
MTSKILWKAPLYLLFIANGITIYKQYKNRTEDTKLNYLLIWSFLTIIGLGLFIYQDFIE